MLCGVSSQNAMQIDPLPVAAQNPTCFMPVCDASLFVKTLNITADGNWL